MPSKPYPLTAINGGINLLRPKGSADPKALYDLLNGYVTQAGTIKVREGTFRNANIGQYSGVGLTKGLVAYQSKLHVFSNAVVDVPPGYELHVINHPAGQQITTTTTQFSGTVHSSNANQPQGSFPFNGSWESTGVGYINNIGSSGSIANSQGTLTGGSSFLVSNLIALGHTSYNSGQYVIMVFKSTVTGLPDSFNLVLTETGGTQHTYASSAATYTPTTPPPFGLPSGYICFMWSTGNTDFANGVDTVLGISGTSISVNNIPLQEIHFAQPFLGGLYVVAEFDVNSSVLAEFGDTYHFWIQSSEGSDNANAWQANTDYVIGDVVIPTTPNGLTYIATRRLPANPTWTANTPEIIGNKVEPTVPNGFFYTVLSVAGDNPSTGASEPVWPTSDGALVVENSSLANDQTVTQATAAANTPVPTVPAKYNGTIAGGFSAGSGVAV